MTKIPTGLFKRGSKLAFAASKLALHEVSSRLKTWEGEKEKLEAQIRAAKSFVSTLSELKGASLKLGQLLSLDLGDFLPPPVISVLETLHKNVVALPYSDIEKILKDELKEKFYDLTDISATALATASIGQVHTARLNGKLVVLKVQYPNVADSIPQDVKILSFILNQFNLFQGKKIDFTEILKEVTDVLYLETDYANELKMLQSYTENFKDSTYVIPRPESDYSTKKVLCMEFIDGKPFSEWLVDASKDQKIKIADDFMNLYLKEFFNFGLVQTDPNPGNFLITSNNKIALLDFGAVRMYSKDFVMGYTRIIDASLKGESEVVMKESFRLGFIDEKESNETKEIFLKMISLITQPFGLDDPHDFKDRSIIDQSQKLSWELIEKSQFSPPPKELFFLHRKLVGVFVIIRKLNVKLVLKDYWNVIPR